jgi:hypothetical protein
MSSQTQGERLANEPTERVFFCPECRRRIIYRRATSFGWSLRTVCTMPNYVTMRRSKNQRIEGTYREHGYD